jgi:hypothetical protein
MTNKRQWSSLHGLSWLKPLSKRCDSNEAHLHLFVKRTQACISGNGVKLQVSPGKAAYNQNHRVGCPVWSQINGTVPVLPNCELRAVNEHAVEVSFCSFLRRVFCPMQNDPCHTKEMYLLHFRHTSGLRVISGPYPDRHACNRISSTNSLM